MEKRKSGLEAFGGKRGVMLLGVGFLLATGFYRWQNESSGDALQEVAADLGLEISRSGQRWQLNGRIDDVGVSVKTTTDNIGGDTHWFTDFALYAPGQPHGTIVGSSLRQKVIGGLEVTDWLSTGDANFDRTVLVSGDAEAILPRLDEIVRPAVQAATEAGWALESVTWKARESGRMNSAEKIRDILEAGLSAARALQKAGDALAKPVSRASQGLE